jgi:tight adherence protein B
VRIEEQLPDAADFIARALRAGHSFTNVLQIVGNELPEPLSGEFRIAREEINYGVPMSEALHNMAARIPLTDLRYLIIAVLIQRETGGNLAEILGNISHIIREPPEAGGPGARAVGRRAHVGLDPGPAAVRRDAA